MMSRTYALVPGLAFACCLLSAGPSLGSDGPFIARVLGVQGDVVLHRGSGPSSDPVTTNVGLLDGDVLEVPQDAAVFILSSTGSPIQIKGPARYTVAGEEGATGAGPGFLETLWKHLRSFDVGMTLPDTLPGRVRAAGPRLFYPVGAIAELEPLLEWQCQEGASRYRVTVRNLDRESIHSERVTSCTLTLPAALLSPGEIYSWEVVPEAASGPTGLGQEVFEVASADELEKVAQGRELLAGEDRPAMPRPLALLAEGSYYESQGLLGAAWKAYREAVREAGDGELSEISRRHLEAVEQKLSK